MVWRKMSSRDPVARLLAFADRGRVPNILLHGAAGSGKKTALGKLLQKIYGEGESQRELVLTVDCARCRGTTFVREDLKQFAQSQVGCGKNDCMFRSIVMRNADMLSHDAQSALRRCIEVYSKTTRFFLVVQNTSKLLQPVISRFCAIHFYRHDQDRITMNAGFIPIPPYEAPRQRRLGRVIREGLQAKQPSYQIAERLYQEGYSGIDMLSMRSVQNLEVGHRLDIDRATRTMDDERLVIAYISSKLAQAQAQLRSRVR